MGVTGLSCDCGRHHLDSARLIKLGWRELGGGRFVMLAMCPCGASLEVDSIRDGSQCDGCMRVVTGTDGDVKVCLAQRGQAFVFCVACHNRYRKGPSLPKGRRRWLS
jgi:hypothetical protein